MTDSAELGGLLERVLMGPDATEFDLSTADDYIWHWVNKSKLNPNAPGWQYDLEDAPRYTSSLDAAIGLVERVRPGWLWTISNERDGRCCATLGPAHSTFLLGGDIESYGATAPVALLAALLASLQEDQPHG